MIERITKAEAIARIAARYGQPACLMCAILADPLLAAQQVDEGPHSVTIVSRFPVVRGHLLVIARPHVESIADAPAEVWAGMATAAQRAARVLEATFRPARVWAASLGAPAGVAPMTGPHLHMHVLPVPRAELRPAEVLSWRAGVVETEAAWWREEVEAMRQAFSPGQAVRVAPEPA